MRAHRTVAKGLKVVGASAGTGKTTRLTNEVEAAVSGKGSDAVRADGLVAVTYTRRAQVELESRIRQKLLKEAPERAAQLPRAYLGTVHAVCLRWVRELALDAGVSPHVEVLADDGLALAMVLEETVPPEMREELDELAERLQVHVNQIEGSVHWENPVEDIITLARSNRIAPEALPEMARTSWEGYLAVLHKPLLEGAALDRTLEDEVERALRAIDTRTDTTGTTRAAVDALKDYRRAARSGRATWAQWNGLTNRKAGKDSDAVLDGVRDAAAGWEHHPLLREDLRRFTELVYQAAALTLVRYAEWKKQRGLVDYVDMIDAALCLLEDDDVATDLAEKLQMVVVDELQDSSPIQLALFLRLHAIAKRSTWVGDPKQCIFEYAGADPKLMDAVLAWAKRSGGGTDREATNYRSRQALVDFCNAVFAPTFGEHGMAPQDVTASAARKPHEEKDLEPLPALGLFYFEGNAADQAASLAAGVARLLASPADTPVRDRVTGQVRPVEPGDIAVLVAMNSEGQQIAEALASLGQRATFARPGLLATPEGVATAAALRFLLDDRDSLAIAELEALHGWNGEGPDAWLSRRLAAAEATDEPPKAPWRAKLDALRTSVVMLSPQELVEAVVIALDLATLAARWPDPAQRLANVDALRKFAKVYEQRCIDGGEGCSLSGLVRFLDDLTRTSYRHGEERRADEQHSGADATAITVMTYHRSKGLEWPVVVMASLDRAARPGIFDVAPESSKDELDPDDPLAGRWIRYWPWPFGNPNARSSLRADAEQSSTGQAELKREHHERARLLYVGFTRARDHLVFAAKLSKEVPACAWLDELRSNGAPILVLPRGDAEKPLVEVTAPTPVRFLARLFRLTPNAAVTRAEEDRRWFRRAPPPATRPYWIRPSATTAADLAGPPPSVREIRVLHPPLLRETQGAVTWRDVGDALHAFLAADVAGLPRDKRVEIATRILDAFRVKDAYSPEGFLSASDAFTAFANERAKDARWLREIPIEARVPLPEGERAIDGRIDLLLETEDALVIVDHKSFPGVGEAAWKMKAEALAPQLATYARALSIARPDKPISAWLHFATSGSVVVLDLPPQDATHEASLGR